MTIGGSVTGIGEWAFAGCKSLTAVAIPDSVTSLGDRAFFGCESLTTVAIPASVTRIGTGAFAYCKNLTDILPASGNTSFRSVDGVLFSKDGKTLLAYPAGKKQAEYAIGNQVTHIADQAFAGCEHLKQITIPDSVERIGKVAFFGCENLKTVTIGDSVEIGRRAFEGCPWQPGEK